MTKRDDYAYFYRFIDNIPYLLMLFLGSSVFLASIDNLFFRWVVALLYLIYGIAGALWIIVFICPYCRFYNSGRCPCGYGKISAKLRSKGESTRFREKFKKHIPVIVPLWFIPPIAGLIFLFAEFSYILLVLLCLFTLDSFLLLPLMSVKYSCARCAQKADCPWMGRK